ncbi:nucleotidyltransferase domain-containing protein [Candidatus Microgenomates bacterium]|nr:nucleotidyltransferase domain-containing protein [Candidatus Microgenomates bacterium]
MGFENIKPALISYIRRLEKNIAVSKAIVFGSYASGKARKDSDVDLLILSDDFAKFDEDEREKLLYRNSVGFPIDLHVYGLTPKEFSSASPLTALGTIHDQKTIHISD